MDRQSDRFGLVFAAVAAAVVVGLVSWFVLGQAQGQATFAENQASLKDLNCTIDALGTSKDCPTTGVEQPPVVVRYPLLNAGIAFLIVLVFGRALIFVNRMEAGTRATRDHT